MCDVYGDPGNDTCYVCGASFPVGEEFSDFCSALCYELHDMDDDEEEDCEEDDCDDDIYDDLGVDYLS